MFNTLNPRIICIRWKIKCVWNVKRTNLRWMKYRLHCRNMSIHYKLIFFQHGFQSLRLTFGSTGRGDWQTEKSLIIFWSYIINVKENNSSDLQTYILTIWSLNTSRLHFSKTNYLLKSCSCICPVSDFLVLFWQTEEDTRQFLL